MGHNTATRLSGIAFDFFVCAAVSASTTNFQSPLELTFEAGKSAQYDTYFSGYTQYTNVGYQQYSPVVDPQVSSELYSSGRITILPEAVKENSLLGYSSASYC